LARYEETVAEEAPDVTALTSPSNGLGPIAVELSPFELIIEDACRTQRRHTSDAADAPSW